MRHAPLRIDTETRPYVRAVLRDTLEAYEVIDLLDVMADICQNNEEAARGGGRMGLPAEAWRLRADVLREAAERLEQHRPAPPPTGDDAQDP
jgi:hypothetical protein